MVCMWTLGDILRAWFESEWLKDKWGLDDDGNKIPGWRDVGR